VDGRLLKIAARGSRLSLLQVEEALQQVAPLLPGGTRIERVVLGSPGDRDQQASLTDPRVPEDFFTRDLDAALLQGACDLAVHSAKDLPRSMPAGLTVAALLPCLNPDDTLVVRRGPAGPIRVIGTSSPRREALVQRLYPGAMIRPIRGAVDARLEQLDRGDYDAVIVASCALVRLGLADRIGTVLPGEAAPLQGHLALVVRTGDDALVERLAPLDFRRELPPEPAGDPPPAGEPADRTRPVTLFTGLRPRHFDAWGPLKPWPMIALRPRPLQERTEAVRQHLPHCDAVLLTSPYAARVFVQAVLHGLDARALDRLRFLAVGPATADAMERVGLAPDACAAGFGGLDDLLARMDPSLAGTWFYPCSSAAPLVTRLAALAGSGVTPVPAVFYENQPVERGPLPEPFDRVLFTSPSTVKAYFDHYPREQQAQREWLAVGGSTWSALQERGMKGRRIDEPD